MGCDIHTIAQVFRKGEWSTVADNIADEGRDYHSYAVLANVRNDGGWQAIAEPRGIPEDLKSVGTDTDVYTILLPHALDRWLGDHSHSWLLLSEMVDFLEKTIKPMTFFQKGVVTREEYLRFKASGETPTSWCRSIGGGQVVVVKEADIASCPEYTHVDFKWPRGSEESVWYFIECIEALTKISQEYEVPTDKVRFVFGFDS